jgi:hypothetical protein
VVRKLTDDDSGCGEKSRRQIKLAYANPHHRRLLTSMAITFALSRFDQAVTSPAQIEGNLWPLDLHKR